MFDFPTAPPNGTIVTTPDGVEFSWNGVKWSTVGVGGTLGFADLPPSVQQVPIPFTIGGRPPAAGVYNMAVVMPVSIAAALAGTMTYASVPGTTAAVFTLNRIAAGVPAAIGTVTITGSAAVLAGTGGSLAIGDTLQLVAPAVQDATLADVGITVLAMRL